MAEIVLDAEPRPETGSAESRRLRGRDRVPAVVYGHGSDPVAISVDGRLLRHALAEGGGSSTLFELHLQGSRLLAIARELQQHPVKHVPAHVDFQIVSRDEVVSAEVPLLLVGDAGAVQRAGGTIEQVVQHLSVRARPGDLPSSIELDVSGLVLGGTLHGRDLPAIAGVELDVDPEIVLVTAPVPHGAAPGEGGEEGEQAAGGGTASAQGGGPGAGTAAGGGAAEGAGS